MRRPGPQRRRGGIDTTQAQLSHAIRPFAAHPAQWAALARDPGLVPAAVEEVLRFEPITPFTARICTDAIEHRGVLFPAGTIVAICAERANRDAGAGDEFDITRDSGGRLLTFGAGPHFCLGSNLARAELEEALTFLAPRMTGLQPRASPGWVASKASTASTPSPWPGPRSKSSRPAGRPGSQAPGCPVNAGASPAPPR